jgi:hypothetical protein
MFASAAYVNSMTNEWFEIFINRTKPLHSEMVEVTQMLRHVTEGFTRAVRNTLEFQERIVQAFEKYEYKMPQGKIVNENEDEIWGIIRAEESEVCELEKLYEADKRQVKRYFHQFEAEEAKLERLHTEFEQEKQRMHDHIKEQYLTFAKQGENEDEEMMSETEGLRDELQLSIEFLRHDIYEIETANAAIEEQFRESTLEMGAQLKRSMLYELKCAENEKAAELAKKERDEQQNVRKLVSAEEMKFENEKRNQMNEFKAISNDFQGQLDQSNNELSSLEHECCRIAGRIHALEAERCPNCLRLGKYLRKLEKNMVLLQERQREVKLDTENKKEMCARLGLPRLRV